MQRVLPTCALSQSIQQPRNQMGQTLKNWNDHDFFSKPFLGQSTVYLKYGHPTIADVVVQFQPWFKFYFPLFQTKRG